MNVQLSTIITSALTAGVVTLIIEWGFKPRLEARKERLLEIHRKRREFKAHLLRILVNTGKWSNYEYPDGCDDWRRERTTEEMERGLQQIDDATRFMADDYIEIAVTYPKAFSDLTSRYMGIARGLQLSDRTNDEKMAALKEVTEPFYTLLCFRYWRFISRAKALIQLRKVMERYQTERTTTAAGVAVERSPRTDVVIDQAGDGD